MAESSTSPTSTKRHSAFYNFVFKGLKSPGLLRRITRHPTTGGAEQAPRSSPERNVKDDHNSSVSSQLYHDDSGVFQAQETSADNDQSSSARGMSTGISSCENGFLISIIKISYMHTLRCSPQCV